VFVSLYVALLVVDVVLMRKYARIDPTAPPEAREELPAPVVSF
jgi:hypothetical protein